jgi:hypothetical protein
MVVRALGIVALVAVFGHIDVDPTEADLRIPQINGPRRRASAPAKALKGGRKRLYHQGKADCGLTGFFRWLQIVRRRTNE